MIVYEKIRASCQQLEEYVLSSDKTRARDLYDIYSILTNISNVELREEVVNPNNFHILRRMFELKEVPIELIPKIKRIKDRLLQDYKQTVLPQIPANAERPDFEYLFMYNIELFDELYMSLKNNE